MARNRPNNRARDSFIAAADDYTKDTEVFDDSGQPIGPRARPREPRGGYFDHLSSKALGIKRPLYGFAYVFGEDGGPREAPYPIVVGMLIVVPGCACSSPQWLSWALDLIVDAHNVLPPPFVFL